MKHLAPALLAALALGGCQTPPTPAAPTAAQALPAGLTEPQVRALRALGFVRVDDRFELSLANRLLFEFDSEKLTASHLGQLRRLAQALSEVGIDGLRIEGHSDNIGEGDYNQRLSERRAAVVAQALVQAGMKAERMAVRGFGKTRPIADNASEAGRAQNRRVVLIAPSL